MPIRKALTVQDGHSPTEHVIYMAMWNETADQGSDAARIFIGGYRALARRTGLDWTTVKRGLRSLKQKLAIEVLSPPRCETGTGATYRVYSFKAILERRRLAGLVLVDRRGAVRLIRRDAEQDAPGDELIAPAAHLGDVHPPTTAHTEAVEEGHTAPPRVAHTPSGSFRRDEGTSSADEDATSFSPTPEVLAKIRIRLRDHFGAQRGVPDGNLMRRILNHFESISSVEAWLADLETRVDGRGIRSWGFYVTDAASYLERVRDTEKLDQAATDSHLTQCTGVRFVGILVEGERAVVGQPCETCDKGAALRSKGPLELERIVALEARSRGEGWFTWRELEERRDANERERVAESARQAARLQNGNRSEDPPRGQNPESAWKLEERFQCCVGTGRKIDGQFCECRAGQIARELANLRLVE